MRPTTSRGRGLASSSSVARALWATPPSSADGKTWSPGPLERKNLLKPRYFRMYAAVCESCQHSNHPNVCQHKQTCEWRGLHQYTETQSDIATREQYLQSQEWSKVFHHFAGSVAAESEIFFAEAELKLTEASLPPSAELAIQASFTTTFELDRNFHWYSHTSFIETGEGKPRIENVVRPIMANMKQDTGGRWTHDAPIGSSYWASKFQKLIDVKRKATEEANIVQAEQLSQPSLDWTNKSPQKEVKDILRKAELQVQHNIRNTVAVQEIMCKPKSADPQVRASRHQVIYWKFKKADPGAEGITTWPKLMPVKEDRNVHPGDMLDINIQYGLPLERQTKPGHSSFDITLQQDMQLLSEIEMDIDNDPLPFDDMRGSNDFPELYSNSVSTSLTMEALDHVKAPGYDTQSYSTASGFLASSFDNSQPVGKNYENYSNLSLPHANSVHNTDFFGYLQQDVSKPERSMQNTYQPIYTPATTPGPSEQYQPILYSNADPTDDVVHSQHFAYNDQTIPAYSGLGVHIPSMGSDLAIALSGMQEHYRPLETQSNFNVKHAESQSMHYDLHNVHEEPATPISEGSQQGQDEYQSTNQQFEPLNYAAELMTPQRSLRSNADC